MMRLALIVLLGCTVATAGRADDALAPFVCHGYGLTCLCARIDAQYRIIPGACLAPAGPGTGSGFSLQSRNADGTGLSKPISLGIGAIPEIMRSVIASQSTLKGTSDYIKQEFQRVESDVSRHVGIVQGRVNVKLETELARVKAMTQELQRLKTNSDGRLTTLPPVPVPPPPSPNDLGGHVSSWRLDAERQVIGSPIVQSGQLIPEGPDLGGLLSRSRDRQYGALRPGLEREIFNERQRLAASAAMQPDDVANSQFALDKAQEFAAAGGTAVAKALVLQAKAYRYAKETGLSNVPTAWVNADGAIGWSPAPALPDQTLVNVVRNFTRDQALLVLRRAELRRFITDDSLASRQRLDAINTSERLSETARAVFYGGNIGDGRRALEMAGAVLDVATRFIPGITWGRDIYEAVAGRDLFSGEKLDDFAWTVAVLGTVTGGLGGEAFATFRILQKLKAVGHSTERALEIVIAGKELVSRGLKLSEHVEARLLKRGISKARLEKAFDTGTRFWDTQQESLVAIEKRFERGSRRVATAVNIDTKYFNTAYKVKESDEALEAVKWTKNGWKIPRYIKLDK